MFATQKCLSCYPKKLPPLPSITVLFVFIALIGTRNHLSQFSRRFFLSHLNESLLPKEEGYNSLHCNPGTLNSAVHCRHVVNIL